MSLASKELRYEDAVRYRDQINAIDSFTSKQKKLSHDFMDRDIICISAEGSSAIALLLRIRNGHLVGRNRFALNITDDSNLSGNMSSFITQFGRDRGLDMVADWSDRIAAGAVPPAPPRPTGVERNVVLTMWNWGDNVAFVHDEIATDKRNPRVNANGPIYGVDIGNDFLLITDTEQHQDGEERDREDPRQHARNLVLEGTTALFGNDEERDTTTGEQRRQPAQPRMSMREPSMSSVVRTTLPRTPA